METANLMKSYPRFRGISFCDGLTSRNQSLEIKLGDTTGLSQRSHITMQEIELRSAIEKFLPTCSPITSEAEVDSSDCNEPLKALHWADSTRGGNIFKEKIQMISPHLALSLFRRPENAVRLTQCDPSRALESEYDLHAPNCGVLGHGAFSTVRLAVRRSDGIKVAVKSIAKHEALRARRLRICGRTYLEEWEILRRLKDNPYIISLLDVFESQEEIQIVLEYCPGGELFDAIQRRKNRAHSKKRGQYSEEQAARITKQILLALQDIHAQGIVHRDVKPENILLMGNDDTSVDVKLCDFGMARVMCDPSDSSSSDGESSPLTPGRTRSFSMADSDYYMAPEVRFGGTYDSAVDMYSLGVTLYIILCGFPPVFTGTDSEDVVFPNSYWKDISDDAKDLLRKLLSPQATGRINANQSLQHPWISRSIPDPAQDDSPLVVSFPTIANDHRLCLDLVSQQLYKSLDTSKLSRKRRRMSGDHQGGKRRLARRASATLIALADLYRGVASSSSIAAIAAESLAGSPSGQECKASFGGSTVAALSF